MVKARNDIETFMKYITKGKVPNIRGTKDLRTGDVVIVSADFNPITYYNLGVFTESTPEGFILRRLKDKDTASSDPVVISDSADVYLLEHSNISLASASNGILLEVALDAFKRLVSDVDDKKIWVEKIGNISRNDDDVHVAIDNAFLKIGYKFTPNPASFNGFRIRSFDEESKYQKPQRAIFI